MGEAGIGKSAIWEAGVARAARAGIVLVARPAEAEQSMSFAGLADLLGPVVHTLRPRLPPPQRRALEIALLLRDPDEQPVDVRAIGSALGTSLRLLGDGGPVIVAIDDLPWLDGGTSEALAFAVRRSRDLPIRLLMTVRAASPPAAMVHPVLGALPADAVASVALAGLSLGALGHVLRERLDRQVSRPALLRLHEGSGGNPLFALEMARASIHRSGGLVVLDPPILGRGLEHLVGDRIERLPAASRHLLLLTAASGQPTLATLRRAGGRDPRRSLAPAVAAGVVIIDGERIRFGHPLYAAAAYRTASDAERARTHRALAAALSDPVEIARHLALGTARPSERAAAAVERGARIAADRGAPGLGAELMGHAGRLTPLTEPATRGQRTIDEAQLRWTAGDIGSARALIETALPLVPAGRKRAEALLLLAVIVEWLEGTRAAAAVLDGMIRSGSLDPDVEAAARLRLATTIEDPRTAGRHAGIAIRRLAEGEADRALDLRACAFLLRADACLRAGRGWAEDDVRRASASLERHRGRPPTVAVFPAERIADERAGILALMRDDLSGARRGLLRDVTNLEQTGEDRPRVIALADLSAVESWLGELDAASDHARSSVELTQEIGGNPYGTGMSLMATALASAIRGDAAEARQAIGRARMGRSVDADPWLSARLLAILGFVELGEGRLPEAAQALDEVAAIVAAAGNREPADLRYEGDRLEIAVALGRIDTAEAILTDLEARRRVADRPWLAVMVARGRSLLAAAAGDPAAALDALGPDSMIHAALEMPLERGRTYLAEGRLRRRLREKRRARDAFERAEALFQRSGARRWAGIAADDLARVGRRPATSSELTETERAVAALAAQGMTNRQVGQALFLSPKSVDGVLIRVYQKLGIHSRAELGARLGRHEGTARTES